MVLDLPYLRSGDPVTAWGTFDPDPALLAAAQAKADAVWTDENWAELQRRRTRGSRGDAPNYPTTDDLLWLASLGVHAVPWKEHVS